MSETRAPYVLGHLLPPETIPDYQRDFIDWLHGYSRTEEFVAILKTRLFSYVEVAAMKERLAQFLVRKSHDERQTPGRRGRR
jgi:hypothetical protein